MTTKEGVLAAAKEALIETGYAQLSTRGIAERAGVPLSQIHYHFGSKRNLVLEILAEENRLLLERQRRMFGDEQPLWKRWEQACDFLEDDLDSGYVRVLQEMMAAGWSDPDIASAVRRHLTGWFALLRSVGKAALSDSVPDLDPGHVANLVGMAFLGGESMILLGLNPAEVRSALRSMGEVIRRWEGDD